MNEDREELDSVYQELNEMSREELEDLIDCVLDELCEDGSVIRTWDEDEGDWVYSKNLH